MSIRDAPGVLKETEPTAHIEPMGAPLIPMTILECDRPVRPIRSERRIGMPT